VVATKHEAVVQSPEWRKINAMMVSIVALHVLASSSSSPSWCPALQEFGIGLGAIAYTLGMRHAFDADHLAIDNTPASCSTNGTALKERAARSHSATTSH